MCRGREDFWAAGAHFEGSVSWPVTYRRLGGALNAVRTARNIGTYVNTVSADSPNDVLAAGEDYNSPFLMRWNGHTWVGISVTLPKGYSGVFTAVAVIPATTLFWLAGTNNDGPPLIELCR
jgi:hypothetical protein